MYNDFLETSFLIFMKDGTNEDIEKNNIKSNPFYMSYQANNEFVTLLYKIMIIKK